MNIQSSKSNHSSQKGFTIIETLVAIAVLMIAIAGPLVIASKGLTAALYSKDQMIASFLAQESMEVIKNIRDTEFKNGRDAFSPMGNCDSGKPCDADPLDGNLINTANVGTEGHQIYFNPDTGYTSNTSFSGDETIFKRYFYMEDVPQSVGSVTSDPDENQKIVHVVVTWNEGTVPFATEIAELITNANR